MISVALALVPMIGFVGLGIDAGQWVMWKRELHSAADLAALAGARALAAGQQVNRAVNSSIAANQERTFTVVAIENPPSAGPMLNDTDSVRVVLS